MNLPTDHSDLSAASRMAARELAGFFEAVKSYAKNSGLTTGTHTKFEISKEQQLKVDKWFKRHKKSCSSSGYDYCFSHTGIGISTNVKCRDCVEVICITDYDKW